MKLELYSKDIGTLKLEKVCWQNLQTQKIYKAAVSAECALTEKETVQLNPGTRLLHEHLQVPLRRSTFATVDSVARIPTFTFEFDVRLTIVS